MQYLACVSRQSEPPAFTLKLLAVQTSEFSWRSLSDAEAAEPIEIDPAVLPCDGYGQMVLVNLSGDRGVKEIRDATAWVMATVRDYLQAGVTPEFLRAEKEQAEQWRQSLTLQNQELSRRIMEFEARREELRDAQELLKIEQAKLAAERDGAAQAQMQDSVDVARSSQERPFLITTPGNDTEEALEELRKQLQGRAAELELWEKRLEAREAVVASMEAQLGLDDD